MIEEPPVEGQLVVGRLDAPGLDPALKRRLKGPAPPRPTLRGALAVDGLRRMIREQRVIVVPNPYRRLDDTPSAEPSP